MCDVTGLIMSIIDSHCHLDIIENFGRDPVESLEYAFEMGVERVVQIATSYDSSIRNPQAIAEYKNRAVKNIPELFWTAGLHPESVGPEDRLSDLLVYLEQSVKSDNPPVAIGETGLDYFHTTENISDQIDRFRIHLKLASDYNLPIILHVRDDRFYNKEKLDAINTAYKMVQEFPGIKGVLHCYTYSYEEAVRFVDLGWNVSFSGIVTYKNAKIVKDASDRLPLECLMVETDAPFLAPVPERGRTNEPGFVKYTLDSIVNSRNEIHGEDKQNIRKTIYNNTLEFFGWKSYA